MLAYKFKYTIKMNLNQIKKNTVQILMASRAIAVSVVILFHLGIGYFLQALSVLIFSLLSQVT